MHLLDGSKVDFSAYLKATDAQQHVKPAGLWLDEIADDITNKRVERHTLLPWNSTKEYFAFRDGEVTIYAGSNNSGKSLITGQIALGLIQQRERVMIASFEMKPKRSITRMLRQFAGMSLDNLPERERIEQARILLGQMKVFTNDHLWFYDQQGTVTPDQVISVSRYSALKLGVKHVFIDSLMKCVRGEDDFNGQKDFVDEITALARDHNIHVHLVHHIRKQDSSETPPDQNAVKGSGAITDQVDNVFMVWRNRKKENQRHNGQPVAETDPDCLLMNTKQRNGDHSEWFKMWIDSDSHQFVDTARGLPMSFVDRKPRHDPRIVDRFADDL